MRMVNRHSLCTLLALAGLTGGSAVLAAQQGTVAGRVTDQANGQPLAGARVVLVGTSLITRTNADGRYTVPGAPQGRVTVRASAVGYAAATRVVTVTAGETAAVDLALALAPYSLDEVVVTSTAEEAKRQVGSSSARIDASKLVETAPITNVTDLLIAKAAGVDVLPGTVTGAPSRVRIRGTNSLSLTNEPVYFVDGIRVTSQNRSSGICDVGCAPPSRINDLNPEDFESVEVAKGPAASALYGTDAANGVVVIKTKHGQPGKARWNVYAEQGVIKDNNDYPDAYRGWYTNPRTVTADSSSQPRNGVQCFLSNTARLSSDAAYCLQDSVSRMGCRSRGDRPRCGTTCQGSGKTSWVRPRCRRSPWTRCSSCARSARCPTTSCDPTACGGRAFGPTSRRARPPASTSRAPRRSSRASCACSRRTTTPRACCRTRWGGRGTRPTGVTATGCSHRTKCSPRRSARTSTGSSGVGRAVGAPRAGSPSAPSAAWTTRAGWTPISVCATTA